MEHLSFFQKMDIGRRIFLLVVTGIISSIIVGLVSGHGLLSIQNRVDEMVTAIKVDRNGFKNVIAQKDYLINSNSSFDNRLFFKLNLEAFIIPSITASP